MSDREFIDTNILVNAYDRHDPAKHSKAQELLTNGIENETAVLSAQVISEFFTVVTSRIPKPLSIEEAEEAIDLFSILPVVELDLTMTRRAINTQKQYRSTYWDSLIITAAEKAGCTQIFSEDLNPGQTCHGIVVVNPF